MRKGVPEQEITWTFGPLDTDEGDKDLRPGRLVASTNTRQLKKNEWRRRRGNSTTSFTNDVGSFSGTPETYVNAEGTRVIRDSGGNHWTWNSATSQFTNRGDITRPYVTSTPFLDSLADPIYLVVGNNEWMFSIGSSIGGSTNIWYTVRDKNTGRPIVTKRSAAATGIIHASAVTDGTSIWLFFVTSSTTIQNYKFSNASPSGVPTLTTYQTVAATKFREVDTQILSNGEILVAACSWVSGVSWHHTHSYLDKATNQAKAAPAPVVTTGAAAGAGIDCCGGLNILNYDGSNGNAYYTLFRPTGGANIILNQISVNTTTLAIATNLTVVTKPAAASASYPNTGGYRDTNGDLVVFAGVVIDTTVDGTETSKGALERWRITPPATVVQEADVGRSCWLAAKPFQVSGAWYLITGITQTNTAATTATANRNGYHIRNAVTANGSNGQVIAQIDFGLGPAIFHNRRFAVKAHTDGDIVANRVAGVHHVTVVGTDAYFPGVSDGAVVKYRADFAKTYAPGIAIGNKAAFPGPIPYYVGPADRVREMTPLLPPMPCTSATGAGTSVYIQTCYAFVGSDGKIDRGPVSDLVGFASLPANISVPTYRHWFADQLVVIEVYITNAGETTPFKRFVTQSSPTQDTATVITSTSDTAVPPETIYTQGDGLVCFPPPQCLGLALWRGRTFAYGTGRRGEFWPSQEIDAVSGPRWNAILKSTWVDVNADVIRMEPASWSECALFTTENVGMISGDGPDGKGNGAYRVQTLPEALGIKNARAAVNGPKGCYFQASDSRYYIAVNAGPLVDIGKGVAGYSSPVSAALHDSLENEVVFALQDANYLALDYLRTDEEAPEGTWHVRNSANWGRGYGGIIIGGAYEWIETGGVRRAPQAAFLDGALPYDVNMDSGDLAVFGKGHWFRVDAVYVHGEFLGSCQMTVTVEGNVGKATPQTWVSATKVFAAGPANVRAKPAGLGRASSVRVRINVFGTGEGLLLNGITLVVQDLGQTAFPNANQRM